MKSIEKSISFSIDPKQAFKSFVHEFNNWWPKEYTWSQELLQEIRIEGRIDGLCTEIGPYGFRCDWGRVTDYVQDEYIEFKWQIGPNREPVPNSENASDIAVNFSGNGESGTVVQFKHTNFERHGESSKDYRALMDSPQGWTFILDCYKKYCDQNID